MSISRREFIKNNATTAAAAAAVPPRLQAGGEGLLSDVGPLTPRAPPASWHAPAYLLHSASSAADRALHMQHLVDMVRVPLWFRQVWPTERCSTLCLSLDLIQR